MFPLRAVASIFFTALLILLTYFMFSDSLKSGMDYASNGMRYMYNRSTLRQQVNLNNGHLTPRERQRHIENYVKAKIGGLYNEGNTCFANAVIQAIAACLPMLEYLEQFKNDENFSGGLLQIITHLNQIHTSPHNYSTARLMNLLNDKKLNRLDQEDAQEFFQLLLATLEKDMKLRISNEHKVGDAMKSTDGVDGVDGAADSDSLNGVPADTANGTTTPDSAPTPQRITPFDGCFSVRVGCLNCGDMEGIRTGVLGSIDVNLGDTQPPYNLPNLLKRYCSMESIEGVECYRCTLLEIKSKIATQISNAKSEKLAEVFKSRLSEIELVLANQAIKDEDFKKLVGNQPRVQCTKTKQTMLSKPTPDVLMVHINRTYYNLNTGMVQKNNATVPIDMELDLSPFVVDPSLKENQDPRVPMKSTEQTQEKEKEEEKEKEKEKEDNSLKYHLKAAVVHYGTANYGHYITFRKFAGLWWNVSDDECVLTTEYDVMHAPNVFMLFYEREGASSIPEYPEPPEEPHVEVQADASADAQSGGQQGEQQENQRDTRTEPQTGVDTDFQNAMTQVPDLA